jgi:hypothetical protein
LLEKSSAQRSASYSSTGYGPKGSPPWLRRGKGRLRPRGGWFCKRPGQRSKTGFSPRSERPTGGFAVRCTVTHGSFRYERLAGSHPVLSPRALAQPD